MVILSLNAIHALVWLVGVFILSSLYTLTLNYPFLGLMIVIVYAGAIAILFLFVIMMLDVLHLIGKPSWIPILLFGGLILIWLFTNYPWSSMFFSTETIKWSSSYLSSLQILAIQLYGNYMTWFIITSLLLLVAMISAIVLTLHTNVNTRRQNLTQQHQRLCTN